MQREILFGVRTIALLLLAATLGRDADAALKHRYSFTSNANDSIGGKNGTVVDAGVTPNFVFTGDQLDLTPNAGEAANAIVEDAYVDLPNGMISALGTTGTFELWVTVDTNRNWAEIYSFGQSRVDTGGEGVSAGFGKYITLIPDTGDGADTFRLEAIQFPDGSPDFAPFGTSNVSAADGTVLPTGVKHHIVSIFDSTDTVGGANPNGTMYNYLDGALVGTTPLYAGFTLGGLPDVNNWLGRSQWPDPIFDGLFDEFRIYDHALNSSEVAYNQVLGPDQVGTVPAEGIVSIEVNTVTNSIKLISNVDNPIAINYYEINSAGGALSPGGWNSLDDQEGGDPAGQGWDQSGGVNANQLIELFLPEAGDTLASHEVLSLGAAFNKSVFGNGNNGDLTFKFGLMNGTLLQGGVKYVTTAGVPGDYNSDGVVNAADYTLWRDHFGQNFQLNNEVNGMTPGTVTAEDYTAWKTRFGNTAGSGALLDGRSTVPEPTAALLGCLALVAWGTVRDRNKHVH